MKIDTFKEDTPYEKNATFYRAQISNGLTVTSKSKEVVQGSELQHIERIQNQTKTCCKTTAHEAATACLATLEEKAARLLEDAQAKVAARLKEGEQAKEAQSFCEKDYPGICEKVNSIKASLRDLDTMPDAAPFYREEWLYEVGLKLGELDMMLSDWYLIGRRSIAGARGNKGRTSCNLEAVRKLSQDKKILNAPSTLEAARRILAHKECPVNAKSKKLSLRQLQNLLTQVKSS